MEPNIMIKEIFDRFIGLTIKGARDATINDVFMNFRKGSS
jgi:hypothetical protein